MAGRTIYPSIPDPGNTLQTITACLSAVKQTLQMIIINAQNPNPNYTPSSAAQVFVTHDQLSALGLVGKQGPPGPPGPAGSGVPEAPNDVNTYGRHDLTWIKVLPLDGSQNFQPALNVFNIQVAGNVYAGVMARDASNNQGWSIALGTPNIGSSSQQFLILNPSGTPVLWVGSDGVVHVNSPIVVGP
jgi:hypothetical protein